MGHIQGVDLAIGQKIGKYAGLVPIRFLDLGRLAGIPFEGIQVSEAFIQQLPVDRALIDAGGAHIHNLHESTGRIRSLKRMCCLGFPVGNGLWALIGDDTVEPRHGYPLDNSSAASVYNFKWQLDRIA